MLAHSILVTGSNRGIGFEFIKQLVKEADILIATCRNPENASELKEIADQHENVHIIALDVTKHDTFGAFAEKVSSIVGDHGLNLLINNAGVMLKSLNDESSFSRMAEAYDINTISPLMLTEAFLPLVKKSSAVVPSKRFSLRNAAVVNVSSLAGCLQSRTVERLDLLNKVLFKTRDMYAYSCSKAALNMASRLLAYELKEDSITVISIHPGWVKTDMGTDNAPLTTEQSIGYLIGAMHNLTVKQTGLFLNYDGEPLPW